MPKLASYSLAVLLRDADIGFLPSDQNKIALTEKLPSEIWYTVPELVSHSLTVPLYSPNVNVLPSGEKVNIAKSKSR